MYISHGRPIPQKRIKFPGATHERVLRALESFRALWRRTPTSRQLDLQIYEQIQLTYKQLQEGKVSTADDTVYDIVILLTDATM